MKNFSNVHYLKISAPPLTTDTRLIKREEKAGVMAVPLRIFDTMEYCQKHPIVRFR